MSKSYKVVCLDYYGTVVNIERPFENIRRWIINEVGDALPIYSQMLRNYARVSAEKKYMLGEDKLVKSLQYACEKWKVDIDSYKFRSFLSTLFGDAVAYSDAHKVISMLKQKYVVGIASNSDNHIISASIEKNSFKFDFVITSEDARVEKPSPMFFSYALSRLGVCREDVIWVGDSWSDDVIGASQYGVDCIWVNRDGRIPQYGDVTLKSCVHSLTELIAILEANDIV